MINTNLEMLDHNSVNQFCDIQFSKTRINTLNSIVIYYTSDGTKPDTLILFILVSFPPRQIRMDAMLAEIYCSMNNRWY